ncbi:MAG: DUF4281 domain-containing protein [Alphaproteobacteria bacterium]|nr:DUF4281 domain-containing protein [Alphaproteobacteria bacterium]
MPPETVFAIANNAIFLPWLLLIAAPRWVGTQWIAHSIAVPMILGATYLWLVAGGAFWGPGVPADASFFSLEGVMRMFTVPEAVVAGWVHYLVFDLFIGAWEVRDAERRGIPHWAVIPCLVLTFVLGPVGLLAYCILRAVLRPGSYLLSEAGA